MPLWKCSKCHHEWGGNVETSYCSWCKASGEVLEAETPLEKYLKRRLLDELRKSTNLPEQWQKSGC